MTLTSENQINADQAYAAMVESKEVRRIFDELTPTFIQFMLELSVNDLLLITLNKPLLLHAVNDTIDTGVATETGHYLMNRFLEVIYGNANVLKSQNVQAFLLAVQEVTESNQ